MDFEALLPLAKAVARAGFPVLAEILGTVVPFPGNLVAKTVLNGISAALGTDPEKPADAAAKIDAANAPGGDPNGATNAKLQAIEAQAKADWDFAKMQMDAYSEALKVDKFTAGGLFYSGWRPAFAWLCVVGTGYQMFGSVWWKLHVMPTETWSPMWAAFGAMLGLRSVEKWLGVTPAIDKIKIVPDVVKKVFKRKGR